MAARGAQTTDQALARRARTVAVVLVATIVLWLLAQWLGGRVGLPSRFVFLFDFAAIAAFVWSLAVTWQIQRRRREAERE